MSVERYRKERIVGHGPMSVVWVAIDTHSGRKVALKEFDIDRLPRPGAGDELGRLWKEVRRRTRIVHSNLVPYQDLLEGESGLPLLVMEFFEQGSLRELLAGEGLPPQEVVRLLRDILRGLACLHETGICHGGIKPTNVFLRDEQYILGDFNLLWSFPGVGLPEPDTPFVAPELQSGDQEHPSPETDLYAVGMVAYLSAVGMERLKESVVPDLYNSGDLVALAKWHEWTLDAEAVLPLLDEIDPAFPRALAEFVAKLQAKNPAERFESAVEAIHALEAIGRIGEAETGGEGGAAAEQVGYPEQGAAGASSQEDRVRETAEPGSGEKPSWWGRMVAMGAGLLAAVGLFLAWTLLGPGGGNSAKQVVRLVSIPPGAVVSSGDRRATAPVTVGVEPGDQRELRLELPGYVSRTVRVSDAPSVGPWEVRLEPACAGTGERRLRLELDPPAAVWLADHGGRLPFTVLVGPGCAADGTARLEGQELHLASAVGDLDLSVAGPDLRGRELAARLERAAILAHVARLERQAGSILELVMTASTDRGAERPLGPDIILPAGGGLRCWVRGPESGSLVVVGLDADGCLSVLSPGWGGRVSLTPGKWAAVPPRKPMSSGRVRRIEYAGASDKEILLSFLVKDSALRTVREGLETRLGRAFTAENRIPSVPSGEGEALELMLEMIDAGLGSSVAVGRIEYRVRRPAAGKRRPGHPGRMMR